jgi:hypothetical protein
MANSRRKKAAIEAAWLIQLFAVYVYSGVTGDPAKRCPANAEHFAHDLLHNSLSGQFAYLSGHGFAGALAVVLLGQCVVGCKHNTERLCVTLDC